MKNILIASAILVLAASCSTNKETVNAPAAVVLPAWVYTPEVPDGIASAQCVQFSKNLSIDQQEITARGRAALAQQIEVRAQVMDKTYQDRVQAEDKVTTGSTFQNVSKQITNQNLVGSKLVRTEFGKVEGKDYICGLVAISESETKKVFGAIANNQNAPKVSAQDKDILYQEFKAYKAHQELDQVMGNPTAAPKQ